MSPLATVRRDDRRAVERPRFTSAVSSEWVKARSSGSTWWALALFGVIMLAVGAAVTATADPTGPTADEGARLNSAQEALSGVFMGQVALGVLGGLVITSEYASRSVVASLLAVPKRTRLLAAKATVVALVVLPAAIAAVLAALALGTFLLDGKGLALEPDDPLLLRAASGTPVYLTLVALLGFALGAISRSTAATVATLTLVLFLTPVLVGLVAPLEPVLRWLPSQAGQAVLQPEGTPGYLDPWVGLTVLAGYVAVCMCGAAYRFCTRDA